MADSTNTTSKTKNNKALRILKWIGFALLTVLVALLVLNSLLSVFVEHYYPTYGKYRLFAIVSDSMEPEIPTGNMIVGKVPESEDEIQVGTVITFEAKFNGTTTLLTHRVIDINRSADGTVTYTTRGDNAEGVDAYRPTYSDVVGIFTGQQCGFFGYFFGFMQSSEGAIALIIIALIIVITAIVLHYVWVVNIWRNAALNALTKSGLMLKGYNAEEAGTIADVLGIVTKEPNDKKDLIRKDKKLQWFVQTGMLPQRPYADDLDEALALLEMQRRRMANMPAEGNEADYEEIRKWEEISRRAEIIAKRAWEIKLRADEFCRRYDRSRWEEISRRAGELTDRAVDILCKAEELCYKKTVPDGSEAAESELDGILTQIRQIAARTTEIKQTADEKLNPAAVQEKEAKTLAEALSEVEAGKAAGEAAESELDEILTQIGQLAAVAEESEAAQPEEPAEAVDSAEPLTEATVEPLAEGEPEAAEAVEAAEEEPEKVETVAGEPEGVETAETAEAVDSAEPMAEVKEEPAETQDSATEEKDGCEPEKESEAVQPEEPAEESEPAQPEEPAEESNS